MTSLPSGSAPIGEEKLREIDGEELKVIRRFIATEAKRDLESVVPRPPIILRLILVMRLLDEIASLKAQLAKKSV